MYNAAILLCVKEALEDLEQSEIRTMLLRLPLLNMEMVTFCVTVTIAFYLFVYNSLGDC